MNKLTRFTLALLLLVASISFAAWPTSEEVITPSSGISGWDNTTGVWRPLGVNPSGLLLNEGSFTLGTATVAIGAPPTQNLTTVLAVTSASQSVASIVNRLSVSVINHSSTDTIYASMNSGVASATVGGGIPIPPYGSWSALLGSDKIVSIITPTTATASVYQDGY